MKLGTGLVFFVASVVLAVGGLNIAPAGAASFQRIGIMVEPGVISGVHAVSADGSTVVGGHVGQAFRWTSSEGVVFLPDGGGLNPWEAKAVSADGSVIVGFASPGGLFGNFQPFRWTAATGTLPLGTFPGVFTIEANGVTNDGNVIVGGNKYCCLGSTAQAWSWDESSGYMGLGFLPGAQSLRSNAWGISGDGSVVVGDSLGPNGEEAFRWIESDGMVGLGFLPGAQFLNSRAAAISNDGTVIIGSSGSPLGAGIEPFRWTESSGMVGLGLLPGALRGRAEAVTGDGTVIVGRMEFNNIDPEVREAFIWKDSLGLRNLKELLVSDFGLDLTGWTLTEATGISADGLTIVGNGINPSGLREAWIAKLGSDFVVIDGCETDVPNQLVDNHHTISDLILQCAAGVRNHGQFVSCVAHLTNGLKKAKMISGKDKGAIMRCAGQAAIP